MTDDLFSFACDLTLSHARLLTKDARGAEPDLRVIRNAVEAMSDDEIEDLLASQELHRQP